MAGKPSKLKKNKPLLGNHQKCWIWGRNAVRETLSAGFWPVYELHLSDQLSTQEIEELEQQAACFTVPVFITNEKELTQKCRASDHQGMIAKMAPFPYTSIDFFNQQKTASPFYLILDRIQDPFNFGAIIRSAEIMGADAIVAGSHEQCEVTSLVCRTSAGAVNHIPLIQVPDLISLCRDWKKNGINIVGTAMQASEMLTEYNFQQPTAVIVGNEGTGISPELQAECTNLVRIPQQGRTESLNVAVSASILLYEAGRQRSFS
ncbi:MAG TPA: 23S rRNA (guanosine(2251)-2'-O)-methyltransferase RlmB [Planctomycetaceae bacterium]|uniref:23S rRNA (guanosine(2251)-2'-O)-methyltransferase RlmB n=1 Tax=Gimesia sp. TaxID=2024833 RepID=UPI000C66AE8A|nr:23S rRNA (guanosine(2251)-2'-O)-methyltransferase RlmB [Gimesia sp.]MAX37830.1 23S rRNA (guanosine(2251)-2'-O)-methyltransferase RlmB [Gimesia sp.]HAH44855.1 23S rRNA (guanosine(2251)-2'-O)-methyltransferase RlmB [Planctomycetaceae bacterium]|tara:strand:+ start:6535 stop:7320 length:786 start_codon:yes stop_codon:yes gene_type:complete